MTQESVNAIGVSIPPTLLARAVKAESPLSRSVFCAPFRVPYRPGPGGLSFRNEFQKLARQARLRSGLASGLFFHRGRASPSLRHQTLQKFKNKLPFRTNPDLASRPISQAHESATDHTKGPGHDLVRTLHRERHDSTTDVTTRWASDVDPRSARLSRSAGARNPSSPTGAKT
jgi:hypothetical protein